jgi:hypothetical protein
MSPPNRAAKRHLRVNAGGMRQVRAACGVVNPVHTTRSPAQVTCGACRRTIAMADAEILARRSERRRGSG